MEAENLPEIRGNSADTERTISDAIEIELSDGTTNTTKRGRGRPRKNQNAETKTKTEKVKSDTRKKQDKKDAQEMCALFIAMFEQSTSVVFKKDTSFNDTEKSLIEPSLSGILETMDFSAVEKASKIFNPLMLGLGLVLWTTRTLAKEDENVKRTNHTDTVASKDIDYSFLTQNQF